MQFSIYTQNIFTFIYANEEQTILTYLGQTLYERIFKKNQVLTTLFSYFEVEKTADIKKYNAP